MPRISKRTKGVRNPKKMSSPASTCQTLLLRCTYQAISDCKLPIQVTSNWENEQYAHITTQVIRRLPRSLIGLGRARPAKGGVRHSRASMTMAMQLPEIDCPAQMMNPKTVEYQCGSSDISQSTDARLMLKT